MTVTTARPRRNNSKAQSKRINIIRQAINYNLEKLAKDTVTVDAIPRDMLCGKPTKAQPRGGVLRLTDREFQSLIAKGYVTKHDGNRMGEQTFSRDLILTELRAFVGR